jgi:hypothetical protein
LDTSWSLRFRNPQGSQKKTTTPRGIMGEWISPARKSSQLAVNFAARECYTRGL